MPVHMGIMCERCGRVYFIARTERIELSPSPFRGSYQLTCIAPCSGKMFFNKADMQPYWVSTYCYERGYANRGEYELVALAS